MTIPAATMAITILCPGEKSLLGPCLGKQKYCVVWMALIAKMVGSKPVIAGILLFESDFFCLCAELLRRRGPYAKEQTWYYTRFSLIGRWLLFLICQKCLPALTILLHNVSRWPT
jgi:hypothetical protein